MSCGLRKTGFVLSDIFLPRHNENAYDEIVESELFSFQFVHKINELKIAYTWLRHNALYSLVVCDYELPATPI